MIDSKRIVITGGTGTLGRAIIKHLFDNYKNIKVVSFARNELSQFKLKEEFPDVEIFLGDIADRSAVFQCLRGADVVIHAAAIKHIGVAEDQPRLACLTNVQGSLNIIDACNECMVDTCIAISTDKAAMPANVYGMTKYLMERMFLEQSDSSVNFLVVRYGNVFGSNGSVVLKWMDDVVDGKPLVVTDPEMTRFFFTINDAVELIMKVLHLGTQGSIYSCRMKSCSIGDLANTISGNINIIGARPGEKKHEILFSDDELKYVRLLDEKYVVYNKDSGEVETKIAMSSDSAERFDPDEIIKMIQDLGYDI